eukprot:3076606-Pleurochrysis_carterae.AAC.1
MRIRRRVLRGTADNLSKRAFVRAERRRLMVVDDASHAMRKRRQLVAQFVVVNEHQFKPPRPPESVKIDLTTQQEN